MPLARLPGLRNWWILSFVLFWSPVAKAQDAQVCLGMTRPSDGQRTMVLRVLPLSSGQEFDEIRLAIPREDSVRAKIIDGPPGWKLDKERDLIRLVSRQPSQEPLAWRIAFQRPAHRPRIDVEILLRKKVITHIPDQRFHELPLQWTEGLLLFPPLAQPGDRIQVAVRDPCLTPLDGQWTLGPEEFESVPDHPGLLASQLPSDLDSLTALPLTYTTAQGERHVVVENVFDEDAFRLLPPSGEERHPLAPCEQQASMQGPFCLCGSLPEDAYRRLKFGDEPAPFPLSASGSSQCFDLPPGDHWVSFDDVENFGSLDPFSATTLRIRSPPMKPLDRGEKTVYVWEVVGTDRPVDLLIRNRRPWVVRLEGGASQWAKTSGGQPNVLRREARGLTEGVGQITLVLVSNPATGSFYQEHLRRALLQQLDRVEEDFRRRIERERVHDHPERLPELVDEVESQILATLRARELAPLADSVREVFETSIRPAARAAARRLSQLEQPTLGRFFPPLPMRSWVATLVLATGNSSQGVLDQVFELLARLRRGAEFLVRDLEVLSDPPGLVVTLAPAAFSQDRRTTATRDTLHNIYLGKYRYELIDADDGDRISEGEIDLLQETQPALCLARRGWHQFLASSEEPCQRP